MPTTRMRSLLLNSPIGHDHFWQRSAMSRRQFLGAGAATALGVAAAGSLVGGRAAWADNSGGKPRPIPGGAFPGFHVFLPEEGSEPATLTDFKGFVAVGAAGGMGHDGNGKAMPFEVDNRFFAGKFVGTDGEVHEGTFGFF
jgi:hypothetical protein